MVFDGVGEVNAVLGMINPAASSNGHRVRWYCKAFIRSPWVLGYENTIHCSDDIVLLVAIARDCDRRLVDCSNVAGPYWRPPETYPGTGSLFYRIKKGVVLYTYFIAFISAPKYSVRPVLNNPYHASNTGVE